MLRGASALGLVQFIFAIAAHLRSGKRLSRAWWKFLLLIVRRAIDDAARRGLSWTFSLDVLVEQGLWDQMRHHDVPAGATHAQIDAIRLARGLPRLRDLMRPIADWARNLPPTTHTVDLASLAATTAPEDRLMLATAREMWRAREPFSDRAVAFAVSDAANLVVCDDGIGEERQHMGPKCFDLRGDQ